MNSALLSVNQEVTIACYISLKALDKFDVKSLHDHVLFHIHQLRSENEKRREARLARPACAFPVTVYALPAGLGKLARETSGCRRHGTKRSVQH